MALKTHIETQYNLTAENKWISFGGSYPGQWHSCVAFREREIYTEFYTWGEGDIAAAELAYIIIII